MKNTWKEDGKGNVGKACKPCGHWLWWGLVLAKVALVAGLMLLVRVSLLELETYKI